MKLIQILGTGCPKCGLLAQNAAKAIEQSGADATIEKVTDIVEITSFGVMMSPALAIDGEVKVVGKVPSPEEIAKLLV